MRIDDAGITLTSYAPRHLFKGRPQAHVAALRGHDYAQEAAEPAAGDAARSTGTSALPAAGPEAAPGGDFDTMELRGNEHAGGLPDLVTATALQRMDVANVHALFQQLGPGNVSTHVNVDLQHHEAGLDAEQHELAMAV